MKKLLALMLAAALALSLAACGGGAGGNNMSSTGNGDTTSTDTPSMTKEEMIEQSKECTAWDINKATLNNLVRAKQKYCGKTLLIMGEITEITSDYIILGTSGTNIEVYLSEDDIANLENKQTVTIVGNTGEEITEGTFAPGIPQKVYTYEVNQAYLVKDTVELTGEIRGLNGGNDGSYNMKIGDNITLMRIYFADNTNPDYGEVITVSGKEIDGSLFDAVIVK